MYSEGLNWINYVWLNYMQCYNIIAMRFSYVTCTNGTGT